MPQEEREALQQRDEILGFLEQSNISTRNIARLRLLCGSANLDTAKLANIVLEVALVKPHKRRRVKFLAKNHGDLLTRLKEMDLIYADDMDWDAEWEPEGTEFE